ncbi:hypothetical protein Hanom_Chr05g00422141 [Helianthus anomalus]
MLLALPPSVGFLWRWARRLVRIDIILRISRSSRFFCCFSPESRVGMIDCFLLLA